MSAFRDAMAKLAVVGQDTSNMIDCSGVIPTPEYFPTVNQRSDFPRGLHRRRL